MSLRRALRYGAVALSTALFAVGGPSAYGQRIEHNVPAGIQISKDLGPSDLSKEINITVHLQLNDTFDKAVDALYDPSSPTYHKWMTNADLRKYAPTEQQRQVVREELERNGLTILSTDKVAFTIRARGTIANVERAFNTELHNFEYRGSSYRANIRDARLGGEAGNYVRTVAGIESHQVRPMYVRAIDPRTHKPFPSVPLSKIDATAGFPAFSTTDCLTPPATYTFGSSTSLPEASYSGVGYALNPTLICDYLPSQLWDALGLSDVYASGYNGAGQTIVLVEGYGYPTLEKDANAFYQLASLPLLTPSNFRIIYPEGKPADPNAGIITGWNGEIALDMDWSHSVAPGAKIVVLATNGQDDEDFQGSVLYAAENDLGNQLSNSYALDIDLLAGALEQTSWDETLKVATAKGITVNFSTGDDGDNGLGTPVGAARVPAVAPHATGVGGTSILNDWTNPGATITTAWGDTLSFVEAGGTVLDPPEPFGFVGGGGGGESIFWPKPCWQASLPGTGRQTPDVSALADPYTGVPILFTNGTEQEIEYGIGGTSLAAPIFTAFWALASEKAGHRLGQAAPLIASLPYGGVQDVLPASDSTPHNVAGRITDSSGTTTYTAASLFGTLLEGNKQFTSAFWIPVTGDLLDFGFGLDSSFTVHHGWDNATGFGTPYGIAFIDAVTK
jgi:subtilase family serine protease